MEDIFFIKVVSYKTDKNDNPSQKSWPLIPREANTYIWLMKQTELLTDKGI